MWTGPFGDERAYRIDEPRRFLRGGLGVVFQAVICSDRHGPGLVGARVGLKQLTGIDDYRWHRLEERSSSLAEVEHPSLSRHLGVFAGPRPWRDGREPDDDDPQRYIVHVWVEGRPLADAVDADVGTVLGWLRQIADGLDQLHGHEAGPFAHRDLHPRNVIVNAEGDAVVIDFDTVFAGDAWTTTKTPLGSRFAAGSTTPISPQAADRIAFAKIALHSLAGDGDGALDEKEVLDSAGRRLRAQGVRPESALALLEGALAGRGPATCTALTSELDAAIGAPRRRGTRWLAAAATLVTAMALVVFFLGRGSKPLPPSPAPPPPSPTTSAAVPTPATPAKIWIGANINDNSMSGFKEADASIGPLRFRRCFHSGLPASHAQSCAGGDWPQYRTFVSWKPPNDDFKGAANGQYDRQISAWAASVPRDIGLYATVFYEPENKMTGPEFVAMFRRVYAVVKAANPSISFGPVYTDFLWADGSPRYPAGGPDAWWVGPADFVGVDVYSQSPTPLQDNRGFQGWMTFVDAKAPALPRVIAQYGQYKPDGVADPRKQAERARIIAADEEYLRSKRFVIWIYQQSAGWELSDQDSRAAWRRVAANGRTD